MIEIADASTAHFASSHSTCYNDGNGIPAGGRIDDTPSRTARKSAHN